MDVAAKLQFCLEVYDYEKSGRISREDLVTVLGGELDYLHANNNTGTKALQMKMRSSYCFLP